MSQTAYSEEQQLEIKVPKKALEALATTQVALAANLQSTRCQEKDNSNLLRRKTRLKYPSLQKT